MKGNNGKKGSEKSVKHIKGSNGSTTLENKSTTHHQNHHDNKDPVENVVIVHCSRGISSTHLGWMFLQMICVAAIVLYLYCHDESNLNGEWILDDKVSLELNPLVSGEELPWSEIWNRDFWGKDILTLARSHKSWRPLCTATYRLNYIWAKGLVPYWFHLIDRILYAVVAALVVPVCAYTFLHYTNTRTLSSSSSTISRGSNSNVHVLDGMLDFFHPTWFYTTMTLASLLYATHPIHVESVANTTGRAEVLCGLFYFTGFLMYARFGAQVPLLHTSTSSSGHTSTVGWIGIVGMIVCTFAAMLSKEHGITLPLVCIAWDALVGTDTSIPELLEVILNRNRHSSGSNALIGKKRREIKCIHFIIRSIAAIFFMFYIAVWRIHKNGTYSSDFICEQNQGACLNHPFIKFIHFSFLWCFNVWLMLNPRNLSADWTADAVPMLDDPLTDPRMLAGTCSEKYYILLLLILSMALIG